MFVFLWRIVFFYTFVACRLMYSVLSDVEFLTEKIEVNIFVGSRGRFVTVRRDRTGVGAVAI